MNRPLLLAAALLWQTGLSAQADAANLSFDEPKPERDIAPWYRTFFKKGTHRIVLDSSTVHGGRYALRFTYDSSGSKDLSEGLVVNSIPIDVTARELEVSAWARLSNPADTGSAIHFLLAADRGETRFVQRSAPIRGGAGWTRFSVRLVPEAGFGLVHHLRITIGCRSRDTVWVDDFNISADGHDLLLQPSLAAREAEAPVTLSAAQSEALEGLCYTWGFLKYYHPAVAAGRYDWDAELLRLVPEVKAAAGSPELNTVLMRWLRGIGYPPPCAGCPDQLPNGSYSSNIDLRFMNEGPLPDSVRQYLRMVMAGRHNGEGRYVKPAPAGNLQFNENEYNWRGAAYPNLGFRMLFLFRYWNIIQYFSPYKDVIGRDWKAVLREYLPRIADAPDALSYRRAIAGLVNSVNDSHSGGADLLISKTLVPRWLPVRTTMTGDTLVVASAWNDTLARGSNLQVGDVITHIDGKAVPEIIRERWELVSGSNRPRRLLGLVNQNYITGGTDSVAQLRLLRNGKALSVEAARYPFARFGYGFAAPAKCRILPGNIGYVNMGVLEKTEVDSVMEVLRHTRGIIFDIRNYPRGTYTRICEYLKADVSPFAKVTVPDLSFPGNFTWSYPSTTGRSAGSVVPFRYSGKVVLLVNEATQSHAEWTTMALQTVPGAVTVGSQTSGADGNASAVYLPGNYFTYMTGLGVFYPDGTPTQRRGVRIDREVRPTSAGIRAGRDEVLEAGIALIGK